MSIFSFIYHVYVFFHLYSIKFINMFFLYFESDNQLLRLYVFIFAYFSKKLIETFAYTIAHICKFIIYCIYIFFFLRIFQSNVFYFEYFLRLFLRAFIFCFPAKFITISYIFMNILRDILCVFSAVRCA